MLYVFYSSKWRQSFSTWINFILSNWFFELNWWINWLIWNGFYSLALIIINVEFHFDRILRRKTFYALETAMSLLYLTPSDWKWVNQNFILNSANTCSSNLLNSNLIVIRFLYDIDIHYQKVRYWSRIESIEEYWWFYRNDFLRPTHFGF